MQTSFQRVVADPDAPWDGIHAIMTGAEGDFCLYRWWAEDKLLILDYFTAEGDHADWEGYYFSNNPLPTMWAEGENSSDDPWVDAALGVAA